VRGDFNQLHQNLLVLALPGYSRFCKDFKVALSTVDVTTVWKKSSLNHSPLEFDQFAKSVTLLGVTINKNKVEKETERRRVLIQELRRRA